MTTFELDSLDEALERLLPAWLPTQRWFGGKDRAVDRVSIVRATVLTDGDPTLVRTVVGVDQGDRRETYQVLIGSRLAEVPDVAHGAMIGDVGGIAIYEASGDPELAGLLLGVVDPEPGAELDTSLRGRPITAEQSNTSLVYGSQYILKLFRRLATGDNQDVVAHRALREVGCVHVAEPLGVIAGDLDGEPVTYGLLQRFLPDAVDGWTMATTSVRDLIADPGLAPGESGGDFAGEAERLGRAVAAVHVDLARALGTSPSDSEGLARAARSMTGRLDTVAADVPELAEHAEAARAILARVADVDPPVTLQTIHGDLHLGQVLRTVGGWLLLDFEGEPASSPEERAAVRSPLRDVAGMLRSFDYAAHQLLFDEADPFVASRATEWADRNRAAFCDGYATESGVDPRDVGDLLRALELDKAIYEVAYEHANRPDWLAIPLAAVARIVQEAS